MYLYNATAPKSKPAPTGMSSLVNTEILTSALARVELKDSHSSKLKVMGVKQAEAAKKAEVGFLRNQINALPEHVLENARVNYMLDQNNKSKELQDFQCIMMGKIEAILRHKIISSGGNYARYRIGGFDKGTYERFFKVEPARHMTKAQLTTALRRSFGDDVIASQSSINKLFDSFDFFQADQMDWRAFLYLLTILIQPYFLCNELMTWAYALYSSVGSLDLECTDRITLGTVKDMICVPVLLSMRSNVRYLFDTAWQEVLSTDSEVIQYTGRKSNFVADPDDLKITFRILQKVFTKSSFSRQLEVATVYGKKDPRQWTSVIEERYYHPIILKTIKERRREHRNDEEADNFIAMANRRKKAMTLAWWRQFVARRNQLRIMILGCEIRIKISVFGYSYDRWKRQTMELHAVCLLQRCIRGFLGRRRQRFMYRIKNKVTLMQAGARQLLVKQKYRQRKIRLYYAAVTIQRAFRGKLGRIRVSTIVKAVYDTRKRMFEKEKADWHYARQIKCAVVIQMYARRFIRRRRTMKALEQKERIEEMEAAMKYEEEQQRIATTVYRRELSAWYKDRKRQRDLTALNEKQSAIQKRIILDRKNKQANELKKAKEKAREEQMEKLQEEMIELWIQRWEATIERRGIEHGKHCRNCLLLPETPEDMQLQKDLKKRIKKHVKEVLRSADKQKIPMEIPEAMEISTNEVIDMEIQEERERARAEMRAEAQQKQDEENAKKLADAEKDKADRRRKRRWALLTIQAYARNYLARKIKRQRAYQRYEKHFDPAVHEYYYIDKRTKKASWKKPLSLGSYDIEMEDVWMPIKDAQGCIYYYNPATWEQTWDQPLGTVLCCECKEDFAKFLLCADNQSYCPRCFYTVGQKYVYEYGYNAKDITYKPFEGGSTEAEYVDFYYIEEKNYFMYVLDLNPAAKLTEEEEEEERTMSIKRKAAAESKSAKYAALRKCGECKKVDATLNCKDCNMLYCQPCFDYVHQEDEELEEDEVVKHNVVKIVVDKYFLPSIYSGKSGKPAGNGESESEGGSRHHRSGHKSKHKKHHKSKDRPRDDGNYNLDDGGTADGGLSSGGESKAKKKKHHKSKDRDRTTPLVSIPDINAHKHKRSHSAGSAGADRKHKHKNRSKSGESGSESDAGGGTASGLDDASVSTLGTDFSGSPAKKTKKHHHHSKHSRPKSSGDAMTVSDSASESPDKTKKTHHKHKSNDKSKDGGVASEGEARKPEKRKHKKSKSKSKSTSDGGVVSDMESSINTELTGGTEGTHKSTQKHKHHHKKHHKSKHQSKGNEGTEEVHTEVEND